MGISKNFKGLAFLVGISLFASYAHAAPRLPSTLEPGKLGEEISHEPAINNQATPSNLQPQATQGGGQFLSSEASKIKFELNEVIIIDPVIFSCEQLIEPYKKYLGECITLGQVQEMANKMTKKYQQAGYILTQVIIPAQRINAGSITLQVVSGRVGNIKITGDIDCELRELLETYACQIRGTGGPLQMQLMERYMLLANDIPGLRVQAVLTPSKTMHGEADLTMVASQNCESAYVGVNNYGTKFLGPQQFLAGIEENSLFNAGDSTQLQILTTGNEQLNYGQLRHTELIDCSGMWYDVFGRFVRDVPGSTLAPLEIKGINKVLGTDFYYPIVRSRLQNLTFISGFTFNDSKAELLQIPLYNDRIRPITAGFIYNLWDSVGGVNQVEATVSQGLRLFGASGHTNISRPTGRSGFTKMNITASRQQQLGNHWSFLALATGQYSLNSLLTLSQFGYGGSFLGRGYDPSELLGDDGIGGTLEARYDAFTQYKAINTQFYCFFDAGRVWNRDANSGPKRDSATSTGLGVRFQAMSHLDVNLFVAKPLSRIVTAVGSRPTRIFFSFTLRT